MIPLTCVCHCVAVCVCVSPVHDAQGCVEHNEQGELSVQQLVYTSLPAQQQPVETEEAGVGYFTGISDGHPETTGRQRGTGGSEGLTDIKAVVRSSKITVVITKISYSHKNSLFFLSCAFHLASFFPVLFLPNAS